MNRQWVKFERTVKWFNGAQDFQLGFHGILPVVIIITVILEFLDRPQGVFKYTGTARNPHFLLHFLSPHHTLSLLPSPSLSAILSLSTIAGRSPATGGKPKAGQSQATPTTIGNRPEMHENRERSHFRPSFDSSNSGSSTIRLASHVVPSTCRSILLQRSG